MKLWIDATSVNGAGRAIRAKVSEMNVNVDRQVLSRATRAVNELRNAELEVLKGQRHGKVYVKANASRTDSKGRKRKYKDLPKYTASAPGEPPARDTGNLRLHWNGHVEKVVESNGRIVVKAILESGEKYSEPLETGTKRMAARPYRQRILDKAEPNVRKIYEQSYR